MEDSRDARGGGTCNGGPVGSSDALGESGVRMDKKSRVESYRSFKLILDGSMARLS